MEISEQTIEQVPALDVESIWASLSLLQKLVATEACGHTERVKIEVTSVVLQEMGYIQANDAFANKILGKLADKGLFTFSSDSTVISVGYIVVEAAKGFLQEKLKTVNTLKHFSEIPTGW